MTAKMITPQQLNHLLSVQNTFATEPAVVLPSAFAELFTQLSHDGSVTGHRYQPGEVIFNEGECGSTVFLIQSGRVAIVKGDLYSPIVLGYRNAGEIIGEMALLKKRPRSASAIALEQIQSLSVERTELRKRLGHHPEMALSIMSTLSARLRSSDADLDTVTRSEEQMSTELEFAAQIQARLLPRAVTEMPGWDIAARLIPARKTSGDFYDFIPLGPDHLGILVADVVDKGIGAALYMAVSRTLIRTFALQYPTAPEETLRATNERIQVDVGSDQFATIFYGVLDSETGTLVYANAGHNPAYVLSKQTVSQKLGKTGLPIGLFDGIQWQQRSILFQPGEMLIAYTDGVSEALNSKQDEFGTARLLDVAKAHMGCSAQKTLDALIQAIQDFAGNTPQFDDITLLVAVRLP